MRECPRADTEPDKETRAYKTIRELEERRNRAERLYERELELCESVQELTQSQTKKPERTRQYHSWRRGVTKLNDFTRGNQSCARVYKS